MTKIGAGLMCPECKHGIAISVSGVTRIIYLNCLSKKCDWWYELFPCNGDLEKFLVEVLYDPEIKVASEKPHTLTLVRSKKDASATESKREGPTPEELLRRAVTK